MTSQDEQWLLSEKYGGTESEAFRADLKRLASGEPLGYVIGFVPFLSCKIWLDSHPLIPRPETEFWVEKAITAINRSTQASNPDTDNDRGRTPVISDDNTNVKVRPLHILDLCAGSGCIGIAVAKAIPQAHVTFSEIDARHYSTVNRTIVTNALDPTRTNFVMSDLFSNLQGTFDFILTNPPYIDPALDRTEPSVKDYEPHHALYGGHNGMEFIEHIIASAPTFLNPHGQLWIEHEPEQTELIHSVARHFNFDVTTHTDQYHIERYSILVLQ